MNTNASTDTAGHGASLEVAAGGQWVVQLWHTDTNGLRHITDTAAFSTAYEALERAERHVGPTGALLGIQPNPPEPVTNAYRHHADLIVARVRRDPERWPAGLVLGRRILGKLIGGSTVERLTARYGLPRSQILDGISAELLRRNVLRRPDHRDRRVQSGSKVLVINGPEPDPDRGGPPAPPATPARA